MKALLFFVALTIGCTSVSKRYESFYNRPADREFTIADHKMVCTKDGYLIDKDLHIYSTYLLRDLAYTMRCKFVDEKLLIGLIYDNEKTMRTDADFYQDYNFLSTDKIVWVEFKEVLP